MTLLTFLYKGEILCGFDFSGHAMSGEFGRDIVCAAVSSAAYMAANTVTDIIRDEADASADGGRMTLTVKAPSEKSDAVLRGLKLHMEGLAEQYPDNLTIKSRKVK